MNYIYKFELFYNCQWFYIDRSNFLHNSGIQIYKANIINSYLDHVQYPLQFAYHDLVYNNPKIQTRQHNTKNNILEPPEINRSVHTHFCNDDRCNYCLILI